MGGVFLSYASEDQSFALKVYNDLTYARLEVWRYQADSQVGVDYVSEYSSQIKQSKVFCLMDSRAARQSL